VLAGKGLLEALLATKTAERVAQHEESLSLADYAESLGVPLYWEHELDAPYASSSRAARAMVVAPCSTRTLAAIALGVADNLVTRAALAHLRLGRRVVLVVRETPLGVAEIRNMLYAAQNGAVILPASPAFYHKPRSIDDLVDFIVGKVLDVIGVEHTLYARWA